MSEIGKGTTGTVLQGAGTGSAPKYSTATYPATAGTTGNLLQSDGTNWTSTAPPSVITSLNFSLTNAQIKSSAAVTLVAAQGSGKVIIPLSINLKMVYGGTNAFTSAPNIFLQYGTAISSFNCYAIGTLTNFWTATQNTYAFANNFVNEVNNATQFENVLLSIGFTAPTGNAANNNTMTGNFLYYVITI